MEDLAFTCWSWAPLWSDRAAVGHVFGDGSGLERLAAQGDPAFVKLLESGVADSARRDAAWVSENEVALSAALRGVT